MKKRYGTLAAVLAVSLAMGLVWSGLLMAQGKETAGGAWWSHWAAEEAATPGAVAEQFESVMGKGSADQWRVISGGFDIVMDPAINAPVLRAYSPAPEAIAAAAKPQRRPTGQGVTLEGLTRYTGEREVRAWVRLRGAGTAGARAATATFTVSRNATTEPDAKDPSIKRPYESNLRFVLSGSGDPGRVSASAHKDRTQLNANREVSPALGYTPSYNSSFNYNLRAYESYLPGWPEDFRSQIEHDMAELPTLGDKWLAVRIELQQGLARFWVDDRLVAWRRDASITPEGAMQVQLAPGVEMTGFQTRRVQRTPGFLPVEIGGYANGLTLAGDAAVDWASMPPTHEPVDIGGVPFVFAGVNPEGHDHIDLSRSLFRQGNSTGYISTNGPTWAGSTLRDPARTQLRVPNGQYDTLHVIAASEQKPDTLPSFTAMFYRPGAGFSEHFTASVPAATATASPSDVTPLGVRLVNGKSVNLYHVKLTLDPGLLSSLADLDIVEFELTKTAMQYRTHPDPITYGHHQGGLPSSVHIYALTLGEAPVGFTWNPDSFGHVWQAPRNASYTAMLTNQTPAEQTGTLTITTRSHDGTEETKIERPIKLPAAGPRSVPLKVAVNVPVKLHGYHDITATLKIAGKVWTEKRSFVRLAPDTRSVKWTPGRGALFGYWSYHGGHYTPNADEIVRLMTMAGARQAVHEPTGRVSPETAALMDKHWGPAQAGAWEVSPQQWAANEPLDPERVAKFQETIVEAFRKSRAKAHPDRMPDHVYFYPEPHISSRLSAGNVPEYWGEKPFELTDAERTRLRMFFNTSKIAAEAVRKEFPGLKVLIPWGDPGFAWPLLRAGFPKELIDGSGVDVPGFERIPERQLHEQSIHRLYALRKEFEKAGITDPRLQFCEGIFVPTEVGAVSWREQMDIYNRWSLLCMAYGVDRFYSAWFAFDCGSYYGAEHYGGCGIQRRIPYCDPKPGYAAFATMTDRLNEANFDGWLPTGSHSTYALRFKKPEGQTTYTIWSLRGKRPVTITLAADASVNVTDAMNNTKAYKTADKQVTILTDPSVVYVTVSGADGQIASITAGETDHADAVPAPDAKPIADLGDGSWKFTNERDELLENNHWAMMHYPGRFTATLTNDPAQGRVLESRLDKQDAVHELMPWYNVLRPAKPITLAGAPSKLGLWARGSSDWGRVIYVLRDAKGERWTSIGTKDQYNCDDPHSWSQFCYDGWRYLTFELPGHAGYDSFRKHGTTWWNASGGDDIVDLPLTLEAVIVQQRTHILYVNDVQPVASDTVALGKMFLEYDSAEDMKDEAVRIAGLRMPAPVGTPELPNPIADMTRDGVGPATKITAIRPPEHQYDGTRAHVDFEPVENAQKYFLWVSAHEDGRGAVNMAPNGVTSGQLIRGLRPGIKLHYWVTYTDEEGKMSKPSPTRTEVLVDMFKEK